MNRTGRKNRPVKKVKGTTSAVSTAMISEVHTQATSRLSGTSA
jgi:hypothetical protein